MTLENFLNKFVPRNTTVRLYFPSYSGSLYQQAPFAVTSHQIFKENDEYLRQEVDHLIPARKDEVSILLKPKGNLDEFNIGDVVYDAETGNANDITTHYIKKGERKFISATPENTNFINPNRTYRKAYSTFLEKVEVQDFNEKLKEATTQMQEYFNNKLAELKKLQEEFYKK